MDAFLSQTDRWSFNTWFREFGNHDYVQFKEALIRDIEKMNMKASQLNGNIDEIVSILNEFEILSDRLEHLSNYLNCMFVDNPKDPLIKIDKTWISSLQAEAIKLKTALQLVLANSSAEIFDAILYHPALKGAQHVLKRMREEGKQKMSIEMEALAADLNVNGLHAWGRLYETLSCGMKFEIHFPNGHIETVPMARRRALMADSNRSLRQAAFYSGQKPWNDHADTLAACLNGIAGTRLSLYKKRGIADFLHTPLFENALSLASLEAMMEAIHQNIELPRRALHAAARIQGTPALHYFDLEAPQIDPPEEKFFSWEQACHIIEDAFSHAYPDLGQYFCQMIKNRWIEAEPRPEKAPGAFCTGSRWKKEERVYMSFYGTLHDIVTLAHEVGHAWHSRVLRSTRSFAASYPMTLAETASNFAEMILLNSLMDDKTLSSNGKAYLIDQQMLRFHAYLINIPMRFQFEKKFYIERLKGELSSSQLCDLMSQTQLEYYGNTLLDDETDSMFWASKMHFFLSDLSFYNFPYAIGYLLSQALYSRFKEEGAAFLPKYETFLADTGSGTCEEILHKALGVDITNSDFWAAAIRIIEPILQEYETITAFERQKKIEKCH